MCRARERPKAKNIEVYLSGGSCWTVGMGVDAFYRIMTDDFIKSDEFVPLEFPDGTRGYVLKRTIQGFCESPNN
ncbi:MAG: hypothetical protein RR466_00620 [Hungatella sp.]